jgi:hypothetical protein
MECLKIELIVRFERDEAHTRPLHSLGDSFGVRIIILITLYERLDELSRNQTNLVTLCCQGSPGHVRTAASLHPNQGGS